MQRLNLGGSTNDTDTDSNNGECPHHEMDIEIPRETTRKIQGIRIAFVEGMGVEQRRRISFWSDEDTEEIQTTETNCIIRAGETLNGLTGNQVRLKYKRVCLNCCYSTDHEGKVKWWLASNANEEQLRMIFRDPKNHGLTGSHLCHNNSSGNECFNPLHHCTESLAVNKARNGCPSSLGRGGCCYHEPQCLVPGPYSGRRI